MEDLACRLAEACSRVAATLEVDDVLQSAVDEARSITEAQYGALMTFDDSGGMDRLVVSGFTPEERQRVWAVSGGERLFEDLTHIQSPLRVRNLPAWARSIGLRLSYLPAKTFLGTPMRHMGKRLGNIFLGEKRNGREFTPEDEQILGIFAAHSGIAISNARIYESERRAKSAMETLIDSSPVGILVFDAKTGNLVSVNEETKRIIGRMGGRGRSLEVLLETLTFRRADGREVRLDELPLTRVLSSGETVRAEKIIISHPDGRTVTTLVNARPIYSEEGEITSVVATVQDMTPLEEMERQRTEFLGIVSRALRRPLTAIKGSTAAVLGASCPLGSAEVLQLFQIIDENADQMWDLANDLLDVTRIELGRLTLKLEPTAVAEILQQAVSAFQSHDARKPIDVVLAEKLVRVSADKQRVTQVLINLLHNAAQLSREGSIIRLTASQVDCHVALSVTSDGEGISEEQLPHIFNKFYPIYDGGGMGRIGGTGLCLAVCKGIVEAHGGRIWAKSDGLGRGAQFTFTIPIATDKETAGNGFGSPLHSGSGVRERSIVLTIDNDPRTLAYVRDTLSGAGYRPLSTSDPGEADRLVEVEKPHVILLDTMFAKNEGFAFMKSLSEVAVSPVILLSDRDRGHDVTLGFEMGASDYVVKPFSPDELLARIRVALLRRVAFDRANRHEFYSLGDLTINYGERRVTLAGRPVKLTATEYGLLLELSNHAGRVLTHDHLLHRVWGENYSGEPQLLRTYVRYLRQKLGDDASNPKYIFTEPRVGYRMAKP